MTDQLKSIDNHLIDIQTRFECGELTDQDALTHLMAARREITALIKEG